MKRDIKLVFKLLEYFEAKDSTAVERHTDIHVDGYEDRLVWYHLNIMYQAGLIDGEPSASSTSDRLITVFPATLTWDGHEFLAAKRNDRILNKLVQRFGADLSTLPFSSLKEALMSGIRLEVGSLLGTA